MEFWLVDEKNKIEFRLPITPSSFDIGKANKIETVNITELGDLNIVGESTLGIITVSSFFPGKMYPFKLPDTIDINDTYDYIRQLESFRNEKSVLRFIVTDTIINLEVILESYKYRERDGTRDIYYDISLREHRRVKAITDDFASERPNANSPKPNNTEYIVKNGDTLWAIAKKYYGSGAQYPRIVKKNNIKNPNLIFPEQKLIIP